MPVRILSIVEDPSTDRVPWIGLMSILLLGLVVGLFVARPFGSAAISFDSQVAVIHYDRIVSGMRLESPLPTTPKPLLTVVLGSLHALTGDWRPIAWATIVAFAIGCAMVAELARRVAGPLAAAFAGIATMAAPILDDDVAIALATPWALLGWAGAGIALTASRPRYGLAGLALLVAALARLETLVLIAFAVAALVGAAVAARRSAEPFAAPALAAWLVPGIGLMAIPIMCLHDLLLTGDPFFWAGVATRYSSGTRLAILSPLEVVQWLAGRYAANAVVSILAGVGVVRLVLDRRLAIAAGVVAMGPGIAAFLVLVAARGIYVSERYAAAIDVSVAFAAGVAAAGLTSDTWSRLRERWPAARRLATSSAAPVVATALLAGLLTWPHSVFDAEMRAEARSNITAARAADGSLTAIHAAIGNGEPISSVIIAVPTSLRPRLAVDLGLPLPALLGADGVPPGATSAFPQKGLLILHVPSAERDPSRLADLEQEPPGPLGSFELVPVAADPVAGWWLVRVQ